MRISAAIACAALAAGFAAADCPYLERARAAPAVACPYAKHATAAASVRSDSMARAPVEGKKGIFYSE